MPSRQNLIKRFESAGLTLVLTDRPFVSSVAGRGGNEIVQIDIQRRIKGNRRFEYFRIFPGHEDNRVEVMGTDKRKGQLVLMVQEPAREFEEQVPMTIYWDAEKVSPNDPREEISKRLGIQKHLIRVFAGKTSRAVIKGKTSSQKRYFLLGLDERQLFIAQLTSPASTVREAHASLKTATVTLAEGKVGKATRQGEWFMLPATESECRMIQEGIEKHFLIAEHSVAIGPFTTGEHLRGLRKVRQSRGKPHIAEWLVVLPGKPPQGGNWPVREREVFIQGSVRHEDHKTVKFKHWMKVIRNSEANAGQALGIGWVD
jgi:hypothetical protein